MKMVKLLKLLLIASMALMVCSVALVPEQYVQGKPQPVQAVQAGGYQAYLPYVNRPAQVTPWGIQLPNLEKSSVMDQMAAAGASWVRSTVTWKAVETSPGARDWGGNAYFEQGVLNAGAKGMQVIAIVDGTPDWAAKPGYPCGGAIAPEHLDNLGDFLYDAVKRLSVSPYNVKHWELWNEPDVVGFLGCWGDANDPYYGGAYYAEMLKVVYPRVKEANPNAQVLVGGLLLDCDPTQVIPDPNDPTQVKDCTPARFLEGILVNGGGDYFNGVSFHAYDYYTDANMYLNGNWNSSQITTGTVTNAKAGYLLDLLKGAGLYNKYLVNTETAVFCSANCQSPEFERLKNNYLLETYASSMALNLKSIIWWSATGHRGSGLLNDDLTPGPAYYVYKFAHQKLGNAVYVRQLNQPNIRGYEFKVNDRLIWVLRSWNGDPVSVNLVNPVNIYRIGEDGQPLNLPLSDTIEVGLQVLLIEF